MNKISRRNMLGKAGLLGTTVAAGLPLVTAAAAPQTPERRDARSKLKVVVTGGHPGDPEYGCGGTIARYSDLGHDVALLVDISATAPRKKLACYAHATQAPDKYYGVQELVTRMRGLESGHQQAEGYIRHVQSPDFALPMT